MGNIIVKGAQEHNLKNIDVEIPRNKLVVITGLSGSGKSSLAFDTIYAEGQRRYVESLSAYARQFLEQMEKPDVEYIEGLSPAIAIQQKAPSRNPRSTVGTVTEIYDYLRLLFAKIGKPHCPRCSREIRPQTSQEIITDIMRLPSSSHVQILAPMVRGRKGEYRDLFRRLQQEGFARVAVDGDIYGLEEDISLDKKKKHDISVVIDRLVISPGIKERLSDSIETALKVSAGIVIVKHVDEKKKSGAIHKELIYSEHHACVHCGISLPEISPRFFSFNSPYGACPRCGGLGTKLEVDQDLVVPDGTLSIKQGALVPWCNPVTTRRHRWKTSWSGYYYGQLEDVCGYYGIRMDVPFNKLSKKHKDILLYGSSDPIYKSGQHFEGVIGNLSRRWRETDSEYVREEIFNKYMRTSLCPQCKGARLKQEALGVRINGRSIVEIADLSVTEALFFLKGLRLSEKENIIAHQVLKEITQRLGFLKNVGLDYLTLSRASSSLAGGEAQRIHLATQIGSSLVGVLYVLDEPTIGLHQRDNMRLIGTLKALRDMGNTVLIVEHDLATIKTADWIIDLGPGAGIHGGRIIKSGTLSKILSCRDSLTGQYIKGKMKIPVPVTRRRRGEKAIEILGASQYNLKGIDVSFPVGLITCVTGVSGSGKSTLVEEILYKTLARNLTGAKERPGRHRAFRGAQNIDKVIIVDQAPIGRTPRSNPATYIGVFTHIRQLFSLLPQSKVRGYHPGRFSFNVSGGRCEACRGDGMIKIEMQFLPDIYVKCEVCKGLRFNSETLEVRYKGKNISEVLEMSVEEAREFFQKIPHIRKYLDTVFDVGLGYIKLGQSATTLSGGEAQRVKLASELTRKATGRTLYILDEPTTGLHFADISKLLKVLHKLADRGNTIIIIEHNLDVIKTADWIIDLGPEGGERGGRVIASGPPEKIIKSRESYTAKYLKDVLV